MGTDEPGERDVLQGLIKLSAAFVHAARGNPTGLAKNLRGARDRLATTAAVAAGPDLGIDVRQLVDRIGERVMLLERERTHSREPDLLAIRVPRAVR
jgi:predicted metal-dependent hydrolase